MSRHLELAHVRSDLGQKTIRVDPAQPGDLHPGVHRRLKRAALLYDLLLQKRNFVVHEIQHVQPLPQHDDVA